MSELAIQPDKISAILAEGDLSRFSAQERNEYYVRLCSETGLNPMLTPFRYLKLSGQLRLYANKSCAEQLRNIHGISIRIVDQREDGGLWIVTVEATDRNGRSDSDVGFAKIKGLAGENRGNAILKAVTKAKRRVTLSMTGLGGLMDETEVASVASIVGQPFQLGDGEGYVEPSGPSPNDATADELEEAAVMSDMLDQLGTLTSVSYWTYQNAERMLSLPAGLRNELLKAVCRKVRPWDAGPAEVKMWVRRCDMGQWVDHGSMHAAPSQVRGEEEISLDGF